MSRGRRNAVVNSLVFCLGVFALALFTRAVWLAVGRPDAAALAGLLAAVFAVLQSVRLARKVLSVI